ncbi:MAG TPA: hypothetical protein VFM80_07045 [Gracilimonas sp.]|uniref:hypothetical protein n=1 Tax=Gracilimonas sp. TaxID=1974203 RepID=UPI002DAB2B25|nr:hypothetical protein [Gracilimonas sp.]
MKLFKISASVALLSLLTLFATNDTAAQDNDIDYETVQIATGTTIYSEDVKDIQGSPLIKESFENGRILFTNGKASEVLPINYDSYKNQVLFIKDRKVMVLNTNGVKGFMFLKPENFEQSDNVQEVFSYQVRNEAFGFSEATPVQLLYNQGTGLKLINVHETSLMRGNSKDPFTGKVIDRYVSGVTHYLEKKNGEVVKLRRLRDKDIINSLDKEYRKQLKNFMKESNLDGRSQKDLAKLLTYYDNITAGNS